MVAVDVFLPLKDAGLGAFEVDITLDDEYKLALDSWKLGSWTTTLAMPRSRISLC